MPNMSPCRARNLVAIPDSFPDDLAAAAPLVSVTAWYMLVTAGHVRPGETVWWWAQAAA